LKTRKDAQSLQYGDIANVMHEDVEDFPREKIIEDWWPCFVFAIVTKSVELHDPSSAWKKSLASVPQAGSILSYSQWY
jgi:hypothetical protein